MIVDYIFLLGTDALHFLDRYGDIIVKLKFSSRDSFTLNKLDRTKMSIKKSFLSQLTINING